MPSPMLVSYQDSGDWATSQAPGTIFTVTGVAVQASDLLLVFSGVSGGARTMSTPTGGGLSYTLQQKPNADDDTAHSDAWLWTATASGSDTFDVSSTLSGASGSPAGLGIYVWRNAALGATTGNEAAGTSPSLAITTTTDNSAVVCFVDDWNGADGTSRTWRTINSVTPTAGNGFEKLYGRHATGAYTVYSAYWGDVGTAGTVTTGLSAPSGQLPNAVAAEVQYAAPAAPTTPTFLSPVQPSPPIVGFR